MFDLISMWKWNYPGEQLKHLSFSPHTYWSWKFQYYRKTSNISRTLVGNEIVDNSDVVGASPVGAAPTTSSLST